MILYSFESEDGDRLELFYNMKDCPKEVEKEGKIYKRVYGCPNINYGKGSLPPTEVDRRRKMMTQENIKAGERGKEYWKSKSPKLVK